LTTLHFKFIYAHLGQHLLQIYFFVNYLPEDGLEGPTHVGEALKIQNI